MSVRHGAPALLDVVRNERDAKLVMTDWTQMPDSPLSPELKQEWADYRAALRAFPSQFTNESDWDTIIWPKKPGEE